MKAKKSYEETFLINKNITSLDDNHKLENDKEDEVEYDGEVFGNPKKYSIKLSKNKYKAVMFISCFVIVLFVAFCVYFLILLFLFLCL